MQLITVFNKRKPLNAVDANRNSFQACFVRQGEKKKAPQKLLNRGQLSDANDWKLLVDYDDRKLIFPPEICATNRRPDAVIWSKRSHEVILIELTVCAEEGIDAAQVRKETRYTELLEDIRATNWRANLLTVEIGARGLVASRSHRTFTTLGFTRAQAKKLCKSLSTVAARCSYAIYLAHNDLAWRRSELIVDVPIEIKDPPAAKRQIPAAENKTASTSSEENIAVLRRNGIATLFHFTDAANLESIRKNGLMSASTLHASSVTSVMNSDQASRDRDRKMGLEAYVRLSFNDKNPMQYIAVEEKRVTKLVMLINFDSTKSSTLRCP